MKYISFSIYDDETGSEEEWTLEAESVVPETIYSHSDDSLSSILERPMLKVVGYTVTMRGLQALDETGAVLQVTKTDYLP